MTASDDPPRAARNGGDRNGDRSVGESLSFSRPNVPHRTLRFGVADGKHQSDEPEGEGTLAGMVGHGSDRYVLSVDQPIPLDATGFLDAELTQAWAAGPESRPWPLGDLVGLQSSFVLLAAGGAGKTTVLRELREGEHDAFEVDLRTLDKSGMHEKLRRAFEVCAAVYLDALDEAALYEPAVFRILEQELTAPAAVGVSWRLACRPAAWNPALAAALKASFPGFAELRLLPLTRASARELVASVGTDPDEFLDALVRANLGRLAASPMRLRAAAEQWISTGELPDSQVSAIRFEVGQLLTETDRGRQQPSLPGDRRFRMAARLGAMTAFSGVTRFTRSAAAGRGVLAASELPSVPEPEEPGTPVTPAQYEEVLGTDLFDAAPDATVSFRHQQYAEYLAAAYLVHRRIIRPQLAALLGVQVDGLLPGPMVGITAWLTALQPDLTEDLLAANAVAFVQAGVELPAHHVRAAVVDALLAKAAAGDIDLLWGPDLSSLAHPGLEAQLLRRLDGALDKPQQLWWIARLAAAGKCARMAPVLARQVIAGNWPDWARRAGIAAVAAVGDDADLRQLQPLLHLDQTSDPYDEVLSAAIEALYPRLLSTEGLLEVLRPQRNPYFVGGYNMLLGRLATQIPLEALPAILDWASAHVQDGEDAYEDLFRHLVIRGWTQAGSPGVRPALAKLVAGMATDPTWPGWMRRIEPSWAGGMPEDRRALAVSVAEHVGSGRSFALFDMRLVVPDDLSWLVGQLASLPTTARDTLASCIPGLVHHPTVQAADLILGMSLDHPAYEATQGLRQPVRIDSETAKMWRDLHDRSAKAENLRAANRAEHYEQLAAALTRTREDPDSWWRVVFWLSVEDYGQVDEYLFADDLTIRPGWSLLDDEERQQVFDLGVRYLTAHTLQPSSWIGRRQIAVSQVLPDWSGVYLLTTLASHDPGRVHTLEPSVWRKWAPGIVGAWVAIKDNGLQHRCLLVDLAPPDEQRCVLGAALDNLDALQEHGGKLLRPLYEHLCPALTTEIAEHLIAGRYSGDFAFTLLSLLISHAPQAAAATCKHLRGNAAPDLAEAARRGLAKLEPSIIVDDLEAAEASAEELAEIASHINLDRLDEAHLAVFARLLVRRFPFASDPPARLDASYADAEHDGGRARHIVLERLAQLGQARQLGELARQCRISDQESIAWYLRHARTRAADLALARPEPDKLLQLLSRSDARLVRHSRDLLLVVLAQLEELQHELRKGASRYLWNLGQERSTPKSEDDISDWVRDQLRLRLNPATVIDREVQVVRKRQGIGTRIDLTATAPTATQPPDAARVIIEAKLVTNSTLMTAMHNQLIQRYLLPAGRHDGIYLVYWISTEQRLAARLPKNPIDRAELLQNLQHQAAAAAEHDLHVQPFLLDISHP